MTRALETRSASRAAAWTSLAALTLVVGCGGGGAPAKTADDDAGAGAKMTVRNTTPGEAGPTTRSGGVTATADVGAMDKRAVTATMGTAMATIRGCIADGRKRVKTLGGAIDVKLDVDATGKATGHFKKTTIGDHTTDACIMKAFTSQSWPKPVGGKTGHIHQGYEFAAPDDPRSWDAAKLRKAMEAEEDGAGSFAELEKKLGACRDKAGPGRFDVIMYLDEDGMAQAVGVDTGDTRAPGAASCVETIVTTTSFPSPGQGSTKITVPIR